MRRRVVLAVICIILLVTLLVIETAFADGTEAVTVRVKIARVLHVEGESAFASNVSVAREVEGRFITFAAP